MKPVAQILVGSQNYKLDGPDSDFDYKLLMMPDFNDFYNYHKVDKHDLPEGYDPEHYGVMSILTFDKNIRKGNINALEMLFSHYIKCAGDIETYIDAAKRAYAEGYLFIVWDSFMATVEGMIKNSLDRYGVTRKTASRAMYLTDLCYYIADHDFALDATTWGENDVFAEARALRFDNDIPLPTKEVLLQRFQDIKLAIERLKDYHLLMNSHSELETIAAWNDDLAEHMKTVVKASLRREL